MPSEAVIERLDAESQIRQLAVRYALAIDSRNLDMLVGLFIDDVRVGDGRTGRDGLKAWFNEILRNFETSVHFVGNHVIDFESKDRATGVVYCRAEHEDRGRWVVQTMAYLDTYERRDGRWYFKKRKPLEWYSGLLNEPPTGPDKYRWPGRPVRATQLPGIWPTWDEFWAISPH